MFDPLKKVEAFHKKFQVPIAEKPTLLKDDRQALRYQMIKEEIEEYKAGVETKDLENIAKELADILYTTYGTILEHGLQNKFADIFAEVHRSNMTKEYHPQKIQKGANFSKADLGQILKK